MSKLTDFLLEMEKDLLTAAPFLCMVIPGAQAFAPIVAALPAAQAEVVTLFESSKDVSNETKAQTAIALATNTANTIAQVSGGGQKHSATEAYTVLKGLNDVIYASAKAKLPVDPPAGPAASGAQ